MISNDQKEGEWDTFSGSILQNKISYQIIMLRCSLLLWMILCGTRLSAAQLPERIIVGTVYNIFHEEYSTDQQFFDQVDKDIASMRAANIDHIMIFPMSQWDPETKRLLWTRTDYLIKKIETAGLKFIPLMFKEEQCSHFFPVWKFKEIKGMWEHANQKNGNKNNRDNVDFADPNLYPLVDDYFRAVIGRYGKSPALSFYNIWNEPHYSSDADHVIERYRIWLQKKYGSLSKLRISWGEDYSDWNQVSPFLNENWHSSMDQIDWVKFRNELNGILLGELVKTLRNYDTVHSVNANPVGTPFANFAHFGNYNTDNWVYTQYNDVNGISYYPDGWEREHNGEPCPFWLHNFTFNTVRCASGNKNYILTEVYTNTQNGLALNGYLTKSSASLLAWTALANNCKGLVYWKWEPFMRGRQSLGRGLCLTNGELAARGEAVKEFGNIMQQYGDILSQAQLKKPQAAVLIDMAGLIKTLEQTTEPATTKFMYESIAGVFKALYEENITTDVLRMDRGIDRETLQSYKILFLPFQIVMRQNIADVLKDYVRHGGWIVADARTATLNELDFAYRTNPGAGLDTLFGAVRTDWTGQKNYSKVVITENRGKSSSLIEGKFFQDKLRIIDTVDVLGKFYESGMPAVIKHRNGSGAAVLSAIPLGASYLGKPENPVNKLLLSFAKDAGVIPDARFICQDKSFLDLKVHGAGNNKIVYAINSEDRLKSGVIELSQSNQKVKSVKNILSNQIIHFEENGEVLSIPVIIDKQSVMVFLIEQSQSMNK
jgi:beta-galactosidase